MRNQTMVCHCHCAWWEGAPRAACSWPEVVYYANVLHFQVPVFVSCFSAVTLFELMVVNNWFVIMVRDGSLKLSGFLLFFNLSPSLSCLFFFARLSIYLMSYFIKICFSNDHSQICYNFNLKLSCLTWRHAPWSSTLGSSACKLLNSVVFLFPLCYVFFSGWLCVRHFWVGSGILHELLSGLCGEWSQQVEHTDAVLLITVDTL